MNTLKQFGRRSMVPAAAYFGSYMTIQKHLKDEDINIVTHCDANASDTSQSIENIAKPNTENLNKRNDPSQLEMKSEQDIPNITKDSPKGSGFYGGNETVSFHGLFPKRQLWHPKLEYPLWDNNWDGRKVETSGDPQDDKVNLRRIRKDGVTRHIILVRHGQYDETFKDDEKRILTKLGREQADLTGRRLAELVRGLNHKFGPCNIKTIRVSDMSRAKETAKIISDHLPGIEFANPDPLLNEGRPSHNIPGGRASPSTIQSVDDNHSRIEKAFTKYFFRADPPTKTMEQNSEHQSNSDNDESKELAEKKESDTTEMMLKKYEDFKFHPQHEFEIIVCHANVIRYFACRALQIPPEAWLRFCIFNCSLTYLTIRPTGNVSCRMLGDIGHLDYGHSTFSNHHGFNW